jgi:hypothetical protein
MFADYISLVVAVYQKKREAGVLPPALVHPSPARLRAACMAVCEDRFDRKDLSTLRTFFGQVSDKRTCLQAIDNLDTEKFKPLGNFLKGATTTPDDKIIEILAWLIDFTPRPYEFGRKYPEDRSEQKSIAQPSNSDEGMPAPKNPKALALRDKRHKSRRILLPLIVLILVAIGLYWLARKNHNGKEACMFWVGDHYQPIFCDGKAGSAFIIPLDSGKMVHFRKITREDTITEDALGSIWYANINGIYECYTAPGFHPIDTSLKLKLLTDYVLLKHIRPGLQPGQVLPSQ